MGVVLTAAGAKKLKDVVRKVEAKRPTRGGDPPPAGPAETEMWGYLTGCDLSAQAIARATQAAADLRLANVTLLQQDLRDLVDAEPRYSASY